MSNEIAKRPAARSVVRSNWTELAKTTEANPLLMLPAECRVPVMRLWMCNAHLMESCLGLAATLRFYVDEHGLEPDDIETICNQLLEPARRANQRGSWDVMADLSRLVAETLKANRNREEVEARRTESTVFQQCNLKVSDLFLNIPEM